MMYLRNTDPLVIFPYYTLQRFSVSQFLETLLSLAAGIAMSRESEITHGNDVSEVPVEELDSNERIEVRSPGLLKSDSGSRPIQPNKAVKQVTAMKPVIDISDSNSEDTRSPQIPSENKMGWYYMDPKGMQQGPFSMNHLRAWEQKGFFDKNFKVWRVGQSIRDAILLSEGSRNAM